MLTVNTNISSSFTRRQLESNSTALGTSLQRLSTGQRINSAKDDAAGLQISNRLTSQVRGLNVATRNANDGISLLQVAEGALQSVTDALQRIRSLGLQAMNGSNGASERAALDQEAQQLLQEINRVNETTTFAGRKVFDQGTFSVLGDLDQRAVLNALKGFWISEGEQRVFDAFGLTADGAELEITFTNDSSSQTLASVSGTSGAGGKIFDQVLNVNLAYFDASSLPNGGSTPQYTDRVIAHEMAHAVMGRTMNFAGLPSWFIEGSAEALQGADERLAGDTAGGTNTAAILAAFNADDVSASAGYSGGYAAVRYMHEEIKAAGGKGIKDIMGYLQQNSGSTLDQALTNASKGAFSSLADFNTQFNADAATYVAGLDLSNADTGAIGGFDADGGNVLTAENVLPNQGTGLPGSKGFKLVEPELFNANGVGGNTITQFQVGAQAYETIQIGFSAFSVDAMALSRLDLSQTPGLAVMDIDDALAYIDRQRGYMGALQNRLESTINNLQSIAENAAASRSRILDTDFAAETSNLVSRQIIQQAAQSVLAQANQRPQAVLSLLG
ncbi:flagellinolysin [Pseudomonas sp. 1928-m]|uniref:flagellinolysin n=1 Tax=Pseudomonas sp. 1928-m TaxID=3033804 RepID=UPI0023DF2D7B|nr:flagellinolysin [Pseudomonas sp. 1928-m]MDF3194309.1 flagellinolysin [Pseudomonas sp. 1928-m]MDZ4338006.1 flagellinolysin [Pseudomonas sp.]